MRDFQKIIAWQKAHALGVRLDREADIRHFRRRPGLRRQLLKSVDSIAATIAEGAGKPTEPEFLRYLDIAQGSAREVHNHLLKARDVRCLRAESAATLLADIDEVKRILYCYARTIRRAVEAREREDNA